MINDDADHDGDVDDDEDEVDEVETDAPPRSARDWLNWLRRTIFG